MRRRFPFVLLSSLAACNGETAAPPKDDGVAAVVSVAASLTDVCIVLDTGALYCAGKQHGTPAVAVAPNLRFRSVDGFGSPANGASGFCALDPDGAAYCWGTNTEGQLGVGDSVPRAEPSRVVGGVKFKSIAASETHTCAIALDASTWCWGRGTTGALGNGEFGSSAVPVRVMGDAIFTQVSTGNDFSCALNAEGRMYCWGLNSLGQLADGKHLINRNAPAPAQTSMTFKTLTRRNTNFACALDAEGAAYCWGNANPFAGTLSNPANCSGHPCLLVPTPLPTSMRFGSITGNAVGGMCGLASNQTVACWGTNVADRFGVAGVCPQEAGCYAPQPGPSGFIMISGSALTNCGITTNGEAYCWGDNSHGQISDSLNATKSAVPVAFRWR
jgi:alpha-tubulin suppressor-like RCC1 family protein